MRTRVARNGITPPFSKVIKDVYKRQSLDISLKTVEAHITKVLRILRLRLKDYLVTILIILIS